MSSDIPDSRFNRQQIVLALATDRTVTRSQTVAPPDTLVLIHESSFDSVTPLSSIGCRASNFFSLFSKQIRILPGSRVVLLIL